MANWDKYPTYEVYRAMMKKFEQDYPHLCKLDSIGTTSNGHKIYVVKLSDNVTAEEPEVEVFYTSTIHGDETTGFILMLRLIDYFLSNYSSNARIASMLDGMAIYINPNANPDGTYKGGDNTVVGAVRNNALGFDLNRNFPDPELGFFTTIQTETQIMMDFASSRHFTLSVNFHGGAEVVNYPWDTWVSATRIHADNNWFINFSKQYADSVQTNGPANYFTDVAISGITNGGDWYVITGGRQDYMNWWLHCKEITIELSYYKTPSSDQLPNFWNYNRGALISYLESAKQGFNGVVTNTSGNPVKAKVYITGHDADSSHVYSSQTTGFYARPIEPGTWQVTYSAKGYLSQTKVIIISNWKSSVNQGIVLEIDPFSDIHLDQSEVIPFSVWPNPFSNEINIKFNINKPSFINLSIYSIDGRFVSTIANGEYKEGQITFNFTSTELNGGSYIIRLQVDKKTFSQIIQHIR